MSLHTSISKYDCLFFLEWPNVRIVEVSSPLDLYALRAQCTQSEQLVSVRSAEHVIWLDAHVKASFGDTATSQSKGIPLGYDYEQSNRYYDLNDPTRSIQHIFDELRQEYGWVGDYQSDQTSTLQHYAGFGWNNHGIQDWRERGTYAVICEEKLPG